MNFFFLLLYDTGMRIYAAAIFISSLWNPKARQWRQGRKSQFKKMESLLNNNVSCTWFHCASAGEFEQGRPLIEACRELWPHQKIVLTFFSPSGYELRKNYAGADYVFYLPLDTAANAEKFITLVKPRMAVFVKYEFWFHHLHELEKQKVPVILISAKFRKDQLFFKWFGQPWRAVLQKFRHLFLQDISSYQLLQSIHFPYASVAGDTRFDRVWKIAHMPKDLITIKQFKGNKKLLVAGSTWQQDEDILDQLINSGITGWKWVIVPHEISKQKLDKIKHTWKQQLAIYSTANDDELNNKSILLVDKIGLLSSIYSYADIAYIGGGFGKGIHNVLEAAVYGIPVLFGPNYRKFEEAKELLTLGASATVTDGRQLREQFEKLSNQDATIAEVNRSYVERNTGATNKIMHYLKSLNSETGASPK